MKLYRKNKRNLMAVLLFVMLLGLSACGGKDDQDSSGPGKQSGKEDSTAADAPDDDAEAACRSLGAALAE